MRRAPRVVREDVGTDGPVRKRTAPPRVEADGRHFYQVHVDADIVHQRVALDELVAELVEDDPTTAGDVLFGARALVAIGRRFAGAILDAWPAARSSLLGVSRPEQRAP